jgi:hypothetical protein
MTIHSLAGRMLRGMVSSRLEKPERRCRILPSQEIASVQDEFESVKVAGILLVRPNWLGRIR